MPARLRALFRFQESGLLLVILALGALLTAFAGAVRTPVFERTADGTRTRVGPSYHLPTTAAAVAFDYLAEHLGADAARELMVERPNSPDAARKAAERRRKKAAQELTSGHPGE
jgi:hypothetical protein